PGTTITVSGQRWNINCPCVAQQGKVIEVYEQKRDSGMYSFPCFAVDKPVDPGCSGGPVLWGNRLCGIVSGGFFGDRRDVAGIWPLTLMEYEYPDLGSLGGKARFGELFERGVLRASDWNSVKLRVFKHRDDTGKAFVQIRKPV